jgi:hypothetical protein
MQIVCKLFPVDSYRRWCLVGGVLFAILVSLVLSVDRGLHRQFHAEMGVGHSGEAHHHDAHSGDSHSDPCDSGSCFALSLDQGLVEAAACVEWVAVLIRLAQPTEFPAPAKPFVSLFAFLLPDRGPPSLPCLLLA